MSGAPGSALVESIRALGWTGGIVMIVLAVALPFAHEHLYAASFRTDIEVAAQKLVSRQQDELVRR